MNETLKLHPLRLQMEQTIKHAIAITEMSMEMKEKCAQGDKYVCYLRTVAMRASKNLRNLLNTTQQLLLIAHKIISNTMAALDASMNKDPYLFNVKLECEKLIAIIERELADDIDDQESFEPEPNYTSIAERIKYLEARQRVGETGPCVQQSCSVKSVKSDVDEKYPENWSRDSLIDLNNVVNLPPVPEDIFTCFTNKPPIRTSSLSSLKGMRKVKLFLQRAANNSDEEDSSDMEDHEIIGDAEDKYSISSKKLLGNIKEETQQD